MNNTITYPQGSLLRKINSPDDLRKLNTNQLEQISNELRQYIIDIVSEKGGHFGASLGVVELTVALHYVFNTPIDQLVWDVGHQAYGHKILTGRKEQFPTNRIYKGLSGFPKRSESVYDTFGVGHSSTSISAALGMAIASKSNGENKKQHIAVIGDGSMTAGIAFEALNHAGSENSNLLVILNDNCMSIDPAVGALKEYLTDISTSKTYNKAKNKLWKILGEISKFGPNAQAIAKKVEGVIKSTLLDESNYFESLNFRYFGPIDGHDPKHLVSVLKDLKDIPGPKILHCLTIKGKGYTPAEEGSSTKWHAPGLFNKETGEIIVGKKKKTPPKYQDVFGKTIIELARINKQIVGVTPAMLSGSSLNKMMKEMPKRTFDVGIAEQHAVTFAAGLACDGIKPVVAIYSTFLQRAYDQLIHDVAIQNLPVVFAIDRAGLVGADGPTHAGSFDLTYLRCIPNMTVMTPSDENECRQMLYTAFQMDSPSAVRYPRGAGIGVTPIKEMKALEIGLGEICRKGEKIAILAFGSMLQPSLEAAEELNATVANMRFVKPLDDDLILSLAANHDLLVTIEENTIMGGAGSAVLESLESKGISTSVLQLGLPDTFIDQGDPIQMLVDCGRDKVGIIKEIRNKLSKYS